LAVTIGNELPFFALSLLVTLGGGGWGGAEGNTASATATHTHTHTTSGSVFEILRFEQRLRLVERSL
jgi:hypothetical protein